MELSSFRPGNAAEEEVRTRMGISKENWAKFNAA
jgi:hypothetical protein